MKNKTILRSSLSILCFLLITQFSNAQDKFFAIYKSNGLLQAGYQIGVNSDKEQSNWLVKNPYSMRMDYPGFPNRWGAVFITIGEATSYFEHRDSKDFTMFDRLFVEMRADESTIVYIGMKDKFDFDDGSETKIPLHINKNWDTYSIALSDFDGLNLKSINVPIEFVFEDGKESTILFRNVRFRLKPD